jgi:hypothetical protein
MFIISTTYYLWISDGIDDTEYFRYFLMEPAHCRRRRMKLAFSTLECPDWSFQQILDNAQQMGFNGIEIRGSENEMDVAKIPYFQPSQC